MKILDLDMQQLLQWEEWSDMSRQVIKKPDKLLTIKMYFWVVKQINTLFLHHIHFVCDPVFHPRAKQTKLIVTVRNSSCGKVVFTGVCLSKGGGAHPPPGQTPSPPPEMAAAADGTHPTGMHSCFENVSTQVLLSGSAISLGMGLLFGSLSAVGAYQMSKNPNNFHLLLGTFIQVLKRFYPFVRFVGLRETW